LHYCAIRTDASIACWGDYSSGQLESPPGTYRSIVAGSTGNCAIRTDDTVACWGNNTNRAADPPQDTFTTIVASEAFGHDFCGLRTDGTIACWVSHKSF